MMIKLSKEQAKEIIDITESNGGYTYQDNLTSSQRYAVGLGIHERVLDKITVNELLDYIKIVNKYNASFGTWYNEDDRMYYLDISEIYDDKEIALEVARVRNEIAIYDLKENKEIRIK